MKDEGAQAEDLRSRTRRYGLAVITLFDALPTSTKSQLVGRQLFRSGTSAGAHYREACRARSDAEFISKMEVGLQELDESGYWLELLIDSGIYDRPATRSLLSETDELIRIFVTIVRRRKDG